MGRLTREIVDESRGAWVTPDKGHPRRLLVDVWYPASRPTGGLASQAVCYMDTLLSRALSIAFLGSHASFVASHFAKVNTASRRGLHCAPPPNSAGFPCLIFSHGNVSTRVQNTGLLEELASHGYVCLAVDHPHDAACIAFPLDEHGHSTVLEFEWELPPGLDAQGVLAFRASQVRLRSQDCLLCLRTLRGWSEDEVLGPLFGRVDVSRAAVMGHSFGGASAALAARSSAFRAAVLLDAWQWPLGGQSGAWAAEPETEAVTVPSAALLPDGFPQLAAFPLPCPSLLFESDAFLGDRDAFCAFNGRMSSAMALCSPLCWKVVARVGHYEYTDVALTAPLFLRRIGLIALPPSELRAFQRHQSVLIRDFLDAQVAPALPAEAAADWTPPPGRHCSLCSRAELRLGCVSEEYTPRQRKAMRLLFLQVRRGDYECWAVGRELHATRELPQVLARVIHSHSLESIRRVLGSIARAEGEDVDPEPEAAALLAASPSGGRRSASRQSSFEAARQRQSSELVPRAIIKMA